MLSIEEYTRNVQTLQDSYDTKYVIGQGVFDVLARTLVTHLDTMLSNNQIREEDYAAYYVSLLNSALSTSLEYLLKKPLADKQLELLEAQIDTEKLQPDLIRAQIASENAKTILLGAQADLTRAQTLTEGLQAALAESKLALEAAQLDNEKQKLLIYKEQIELEKAKIEVTKAQQASEEAKADLYKRQEKGFDDDAKLRVLKIFVDAWGMAFSVASNDPNLVVPQSINKSVIDSVGKNLLVDSQLGVTISSNPYSGLI